MEVSYYCLLFLLVKSPIGASFFSLTCPRAPSAYRRRRGAPSPSLVGHFLVWHRLLTLVVLLFHVPLDSSFLAPWIDLLPSLPFGWTLRAHVSAMPSSYTTRPSGYLRPPVARHQWAGTRPFRGAVQGAEAVIRSPPAVLRPRDAAVVRLNLAVFHARPSCLGVSASWETSSG